jgi:hypothetical protein
MSKASYEWAESVKNFNSVKVQSQNHQNTEDKDLS